MFSTFAFCKNCNSATLAFPVRRNQRKKLTFSKQYDSAKGHDVQVHNNSNSLITEETNE